MFKTLPCKAQDNERVISFSIAPLSDFCDKTDQILNDITSENMEEIEKMTLDFDEVKAYFKELKDYEFTKNFLQYFKMILYLESEFNMFKTKIQSSIQKLLPKIRGPRNNGENPENELTTLVSEYKSSPFRKNLLFTLLKTRKKEIETVELVIYNEDLKDLKHVYINYDDDANMATCIMNHPFAIEYELQILPEDPQNMLNIWKKCKNKDKSDDDEDCPFDEYEKWFMKTVDVGANQPLIQAFTSFAKSSEKLGSKLCFLISLRKLKSVPKDDTLAKKNDMPKNPHFQLKLKKHGRLIIPHFQPPEKLNKWKTVDRGWDSLTIEMEHAKLNLSQYFNFNLTTEVEAVVEAFETSVVNIIAKQPLCTLV